MIRDFGQSRLTGLLPQQAAAVRAPAGAYDLLRGRRAKDRIEISPEQPGLLIERRTHIAKITLDQNLNVRMIDEAGLPVDLSVVHIEVRDPEGLIRHYSGNVARCHQRSYGAGFTETLIPTPYFTFSRGSRSNWLMTSTSPTVSPRLLRTGASSEIIPGRRRTVTCAPVSSTRFISGGTATGYHKFARRISVFFVNKALARSPDDDDLATGLLTANLIRGNYQEAEKLIETHRFAPRGIVLTLSVTDIGTCATEWERRPAARALMRTR